MIPALIRLLESSERNVTGSLLLMTALLGVLIVVLFFVGSVVAMAEGWKPSTTPG